jgi:peptidyl-prolyl cis-trans isomerase A (cyclophilin A)
MKTRLYLSLIAFGLLSCQKSEPEPEQTPATVAPQTKTTSQTVTAAAQRPPHPLMSLSSGGPPDPEPDFGLDKATAGLPGKGTLIAHLETSLGKLDCSLYADRAPKSVATFVGLARGVRPWRDKSGEWVKRPAYDGTIFHRIIKGFMIQGGDVLGRRGAGEPGFNVVDERWPGASHDRRGLLCMANRGPNTNGSQFFILDAAAAHLDRAASSYTIFGECGPDDVIAKLADVPVQGERPIEPPVVRRVTVSRKQ